MKLWTPFTLLGTIPFNKGIGVVTQFKDSDEIGIVGIHCDDYRGKENIEFSFLTNSLVKAPDRKTILSLFKEIMKLVDNIEGANITVYSPQFNDIRMYRVNGFDAASIKDPERKYFNNLNFILKATMVDYSPTVVSGEGFSKDNPPVYDQDENGLFTATCGNEMYSFKTFYGKRAGTLGLSIRKTVKDDDGVSNQIVGSLHEVNAIFSHLYVDSKIQVVLSYDGKGDIISPPANAEANHSLGRKIAQRISGENPDGNIRQKMNREVMAVKRQSNPFRVLASK